MPCTSPPAPFHRRFGESLPPDFARGLVSLQMIAGLGVLGMVAKVSFHAAKLRLNKQP